MPIKSWGEGWHRVLIFFFIIHFLGTVSEFSFGINGLSRLIITFRDSHHLQYCSCGKQMNECLTECLLVCSRSKIGICTGCSSWLFLLLFVIMFAVIDMICLLAMDKVRWTALIGALPVISVVMNDCVINFYLWYLASWAFRVEKCTLWALPTDVESVSHSWGYPQRNSARCSLIAWPIWD